MSNFKPRFDTLNELYANSVEVYADRPLFGFKEDDQWSWITYREFGDRVDRARAGLADRGVTKGDRVAIISDNCPEWGIAAYAAYGLGAAVVPMYEAQTDENWRYILSDSGAIAAFVADDLINKRVASFELSELKHVITFRGDGTSTTLDSISSSTGAAAEPVVVDGKDVAGFVYTSGTTGKPKGVVLSHANIANNVSAVLSVFTLEPEDRSLSFLPWAHAFGQTVELHALLASGCSTGFAESVPKIVDNLAEVQPTMLVSVPRIFTKIYDGLNKMMVEKGGVTKSIFDAAMSNAEKRRQLEAAGGSSRWLNAQHALFDRIVFSKVRERFGGNLKYAISGGAAIPVEVAQFIDALGITVYEGYGLSETSPIATANWQGTRRIGSVGKPIPGVRVELDVALSADPRDGEIIVYGHNVMQGYHNLPDETKNVFNDQGGFRTGDLGRFDEDGFLYITGRVKEQYKLANGKYVVPTPIEDQLSLSPYFASIMVYGDNRPFNIALIVPDREALEEWASSRDIDLDDSPVSENPAVVELIASEVHTINDSLKGYERIKNQLIIEEDFTTENGMLTPTLKVKRRVVLDRYQQDIESLYV